MTWTYSGNPSNSLSDEVRFLIEDTDKEEHLLSDEEIAYLLAQNSNSPGQAAAIAARILATKFARLMDKTIGPIHISYSQRFDHYKQLAADLADIYGVYDRLSIYVGGLSHAEKDTAKQDTDLVQPKFTRDLFDSTDSTSTEEEE